MQKSTKQRVLIGLMVFAIATQVFAGDYLMAAVLIGVLVASLD